MFAIVVSVVSVVTVVVSVFALIIQHKSMKKLKDNNEHMAVDMAYYENEMYKYSNLLDAEVSSKIQELKTKNTEIAAILVDLAYYEDKMYKYSNQLEDKNAEIAYYEKNMAYVDDYMRSTILEKNNELDVYRRRINAMEEMEEMGMAY
jgi:hypothetical protein